MNSIDKPDYLISTPENVDLHLELAGLGNRILAAFIDRVIIGCIIALLLGIAIAVGVAVDRSSIETAAKTIIYYYLIGIDIFLIFVVAFGYFIVFEGYWHGQTIGKRAVGIRVIESNGQPIGWPAVFIRNLIRVIDDAGYIGVLCMIIDKNERRFGDLAGGTLVIRERVQSIGASNIVINSSDEELIVDTGQISPDEYDLLVSFLKRRELMARNQRQRLAYDLAKHFDDKLHLNTETQLAPEQTIEKLYIAYKKRAEIEAD